jgi:hypothetical protein
LDFQVTIGHSGMMQLTYDNWGTIFCLKKNSELKRPNSFSMVDPSFDVLSAFREGFFADVIIQSSNGTQVGFNWQVRHVRQVRQVR